MLFALVAFWREFSAWPRRLTLVSHGFKRARLVEGHCAAIGFPLDRVGFVGVDPPSMVPVAVGGSGAGGAVVEKQAAMAGSLKTADIWALDPHGVGPVLAGKRSGRNPWSISQLLFASDEERIESGLVTTLLKDGTESLVDDAPRPWTMDKS